MSSSGKKRRPPAAPGRIAPARPSWSLLGTEPWRAATEWLAHALDRASPPTPGDGHPVIVFPGLASDGRALAPLRDHCARLGYQAMDWGRGLNVGPKGDLDEWLFGLAEELRDRLGPGAPAPTLIGWSLGGLYARELAKIGWPVRQVITVGTPFNGRPEHTHAAWLYRWLHGAPAELDAALHRRLRVAPPVPTTSIYSRSDGIVAWQACRHDRPGPRVQDIEVQGSHLGMGWNSRVMQIVADRLAQPAGRWRRMTDVRETAAGVVPPPRAPRLPLLQRLASCRATLTQAVPVSPPT